MAAPDFCFVHAADLHLDTPFSGIGSVAPRVARELREASLAAFDTIIELALERDAAFLLVAGDVYDGAERGLRAQLRFRDGLARLADAGISSFVVHGNHDPLRTGWSAITTWPERVTIFGCDPHQIQVVPLERSGEVIATVQGLSYAKAATTENLARHFTRPEGAGVHIGLLHCNVEGAAEGHANYSPCSLEDLRRTGLDYLALGHIHEHQVLARGGAEGPWVVYPGNSQARSPRASEQGAKGAVVATVEDGAVREVELVPCDLVRFCTATLDISASSDLSGLATALVEAGRAEAERAEGRAAVLRGRLVGRGPLHHELGRQGVRDELLAALRDDAEGTSPLCWWDSLVVESAAPLERAALRTRGDFAADLLTLGEGLLGDPAAAEALLAEIGAPPRAIARRLADLLDAEGAAALIDAALERALACLGEDRAT